MAETGEVLLRRLKRVILQRLHRLGYALWCWTDDRMPDDEPRRG